MTPLLLLLLACDPATDVNGASGPPAIDAAGEAPAPSEDLRELLKDVQHLLGEAAAMHAAGRLREASVAFDRATSLYRRHLAAPLRQGDARATLALEYEIGRLGKELTSPRGRPKGLAGRVDRLLEEQRPALTPPPKPPAPPTTP